MVEDGMRDAVEVDTVVDVPDDVEDEDAAAEEDAAAVELDPPLAIDENDPPD